MSRGARYISAENLDKDDFGAPFSLKEGEFVYDARLRAGSQWAMMSQKSWEKYGCGQLGLGLGQKYRRDAEGRLMKVEG